MSSWIWVRMAYPKRAGSVGTWKSCRISAHVQGGPMTLCFQESVFVLLLMPRRLQSSPGEGTGTQDNWFPALLGGCRCQYFGYAETRSALNKIYKHLDLVFFYNHGSDSKLFMELISLQELDKRRTLPVA
jgi:hypothetical protein